MHIFRKSQLRLEGGDERWAKTVYGTKLKKKRFSEGVKENVKRN